jgi:LPS-assembly lipoprotein
MGIGLLAALGLSGCGWRIRGGYNFGFESFMVISPADSPKVVREKSKKDEPKKGVEVEQNYTGSDLASKLRRELKFRYKLKLVSTPAEADVLIRLVAVNSSTIASGYSGSGRVREVSIHESVEYRAEDKLGRALLETDIIQLQRFVTIDDTNPQAKNNSEKFLRGVMEEDILQQILRRLATISTYADPARSEKA